MTTLWKFAAIGSSAAKRYNSMMNEKVKALSQEARKLAPAERAALIDELIAGLARPDASLDAVWAKEAKDRLAAYDRGEMATHTIPEVVTKLRAQ